MEFAVVRSYLKATVVTNDF